VVAAVDWETGEERTNASPHERGTGRTYVITNTRRLKRLQEIASHRQLDCSKLRIACLIRNKGIGWLLIEQPIRNSFKSPARTSLGHFSILHTLRSRWSDTCHCKSPVTTSTTVVSVGTWTSQSGGSRHSSDLGNKSCIAHNFFVK
jgi:hypothetical protein